MSEMRILDGTGDTKLIWDANDPVSVEAAETMFKGLVDKGQKAFGVKENGLPGVAVSKFDKTLEKIIFVPQLRGG